MNDKQEETESLKDTEVLLVVSYYLEDLEVKDLNSFFELGFSQEILVFSSHSVTIIIILEKSIASIDMNINNLIS
jgi:hypothetical protein